MTPDTRMVTDADAAEMQAHIMANSDDAVADYKDMAECLLADRERRTALLTGLLPAVECPWEEDGTCTSDNCMKEEARELLKEAHGE